MNEVKMPWWVPLIWVVLTLIFVGSLATNVYLLTKSAPTPGMIIVTNNSLPLIPLPATNDASYVYIQELNFYHTAPFNKTNLNDFQTRISLVDRWCLVDWHPPIYWNIISIGAQTTTGFWLGYARRLFEQLPLYAGGMVSYNPWSTNLAFGLYGSVVY